MPVCPQCDNRHFNTKEALLQHMRSSSAWHPFCTSCDRRFVSQTAYDAHMAAKHPPTFDCTLCNRPYHAPFALEDHYRGSNVHPNCTKCGRGFRDQAACDEHRTTMHPKSACAPCGGKLFYDDELQNHYWDSPNHPKCHTCSTGCKDEQIYLEHMSAAHPEQHCPDCSTSFEASELLQAHLWTSSVHPKCDRCNMGFANMEAKDFHSETVHTPKLAAALPIVPEDIQPISEQKSETSTYGSTGFSPLSSETSTYGSTGFTPLSPRNPIQSLILGERRINSPDLRLELGFSSPIIDVKPPYSPASLPRPGVKIEELWNLTQNVQISPTRIPHVTTPPRIVDSYASNRIGYYRYPGAGSATSSSWSDPAHSPPRSRSIQPAAAAARSFSPVRSADFHPRLYPGSVRAASLSRPGLLTETNAAGLPSRTLLRSDAASVSGGTAYAFPQGRGTYAGAAAASIAGDVAPSSSFAYGPGRYARSSSAESINWEELMGAASFERQLPAGDAPSPTTAVCESPEPSPLTPAQAQVHLRVVPQSLVHSPSLATVSSPASSALGHSPIGSGAYEADTRPTTASSTPSCRPLHGLMYTVTPSSECSSPSPIQPPDLSSPMSLRSLPSMSPLAATPIDIAGYDIPEAQRPLPDSPTEFQSPITVVDALPAPAAPPHVDPEPDVLKLAPLLPPAASPQSSVQSFITSPQEPDLEPASALLIDAPHASPASTPPLPHELPTAELEAEFGLPIFVDEGADTTGAGAFRTELPDAAVVGVVASPGSVTPVASKHGAAGLSETEVDSEGAPPPKATPANLNPLHCRACLADSCDDITASMCGHIFCNRCITDAVIRTSRCPVCMTPTLLYCLFRLDIAA